MRVGDIVCPRPISNGMEHGLLYVGVAILGVIVGSFLTAFVARYGVKTMARGRSACSSCGITLSARDLIPVVSFLWQKGRCRHCESKISYSYIGTELGTALLFVLVFHKVFGGTVESIESAILFVLYAATCATLLALSLYDLKHFIIPDKLVFIFAGLGYVTRITELVLSDVSITYMHIVSGPLLAIPFLLMWLISRGTWIGFGDVKLAVGIGGFLGIISGISALILGVWIGTVVSLVLIMFSHTGLSLGSSKKKITIKSEVPFGPFLALGTYTALFFFPDVLNISILLL